LKDDEEPLEDLRTSIQAAARKSGMVFNPFNPLATKSDPDLLQNLFKSSRTNAAPIHED